MRVDLPDDQWVDMRGPEELLAGDRLAVNESFTIPIDTSDVRDKSAGELERHVKTGISGALSDRQRIALLTRIITAWSFDQRGLPIPSLSPMSIEQLPLKHYNALYGAVEPHMEEINYRPNRETSSDSPTTSEESRSTPAA